MTLPLPCVFHCLRPKTAPFLAVFQVLSRPHVVGSIEDACIDVDDDALSAITKLHNYINMTSFSSSDMMNKIDQDSVCFHTQPAVFSDASPDLLSAASIRAETDGRFVGAQDGELDASEMASALIGAGEQPI